MWTRDSTFWYSSSEENNKSMEHIQVKSMHIEYKSLLCVIKYLGFLSWQWKHIKIDQAKIIWLLRNMFWWWWWWWCYCCCFCCNLMMEYVFLYTLLQIKTCAKSMAQTELTNNNTRKLFSFIRYCFMRVRWIVSISYEFSALCFVFWLMNYGDLWQKKIYTINA